MNDFDRYESEMEFFRWECQLNETVRVLAWAKQELLSLARGLKGNPEGGLNGGQRASDDFKSKGEAK